MSSLTDQLNAVASSLSLNAAPPNAGQPVSVSLSPDPTTMTISDALTAGVQRVTALIKFVRFADDAMPDAGTTISDFVKTPGQVLGGQAVPAISVQLPGAALPGARIPVLNQDLQTSGTASLTNLSGLTITGPTAQDVPQPAPGTLPTPPSLGPASSGDDPTRDLLAGIPGILAAIETGVADALKYSVSVTVTWTFGVTDSHGNTVGTPLIINNGLAALTVIPPLVFSDLGMPQTFTLTITAQGHVAASSASVQFGPISTSVPFPAISIPRFAALCTWPKYGTQSTSDDNSPDDNSTLLLFPANTTLSGAQALDLALQQLRQTIASLTNLINTATAAVVILGDATASVALLGALDSALGFALGALERPLIAGHSDYIPLKTVFAAATTASPTFGGFADLNGIWWDSENAGIDHDYYHDHAKSWLVVGQPGASVVIHRGNNFDSGNKLTLVTGGACVVGVPDFRGAPSTFDPAFAVPGIPPQQATLVGSLANWSDSVEFF
jgi:hypothetical protein